MSKSLTKTIWSPEYSRLLRRLRQERVKANLTQAQLGQRIGQSQSFVGKCERGERRLDVVELAAFCHAIGISFLGFVKDLEEF